MNKRFEQVIAMTKDQFDTQNQIIEVMQSAISLESKKKSDI